MERQRLGEQVELNTSLYRKAVDELWRYHGHVERWRFLTRSLLSGLLEKGELDPNLIADIADQTLSGRVQRWAVVQLKGLTGLRVSRIGPTAFHQAAKAIPPLSQRNQIEADIIGRQGDLAICYRAARERRSDLKGTLLASFVVLPGGRVSQLTVFSTVPGELSSCVSGRIKAWFLPAAEDHHFVQVELAVHPEGIKMKVVAPTKDGVP